MKRRLTILVGVFILLLGTIMILPALGKHQQRNRAAIVGGMNFFGAEWTKDEAYGLAWGTALAVVGAATISYGLIKRKAWQHVRS